MKKLTEHQIEALIEAVAEIPAKHTGWTSKIRFRRWTKHGKDRLYYEFRHYDRDGKLRNHSSGDGYIDIESGEIIAPPSDKRLISELAFDLEEQKLEELIGKGEMRGTQPFDVSEEEFEQDAFVCDWRRDDGALASIRVRERANSVSVFVQIPNPDMPGGKAQYISCASVDEAEALLDRRGFERHDPPTPIGRRVRGRTNANVEFEGEIVSIDINNGYVVIEDEGGRHRLRRWELV